MTAEQIAVPCTASPIWWTVFINCPTDFSPHPINVLMIHLPFGGKTEKIAPPSREGEGEGREDGRLRRMMLRMITVVTRMQAGRDNFNKAINIFMGRARVG